MCANYLPDNSHNWPFEIEEIYISISICLLKGIYVSNQSPKLFDRVQQLSLVQFLTMHYWSLVDLIINPPEVSSALGAG